MKKVFLLLVLINIISYSKCELKVKKLIESATIIEEYHSYLEPEYKGNNVYETTIFDENGNLTPVLQKEVDKKAAEIKEEQKLTGVALYDVVAKELGA